MAAAATFGTNDGMFSHMDGRLAQYTNPSGSTGFNKYSPYFGEPVNHATQSARRDTWRREDIMPAAYEGHNGHLSDLVEGLVVMTGGFLNAVALPFQASDELSWTWDEYRFDTHFLDEVPHEGIPRMLKHAHESHQAHTVRRGGMIYFEKDFMTTAAGIRDYARVITQVKNSVIATCQFDALVAIMGAHQDQIEWQRQHGILKLTPEKRVEWDREMFGIVQKADNGKGMIILHGKLMTMASNAGIEPNMYIFRQGIVSWFNTVPVEMTQFMYGGQQAVDRLFAAPSAHGMLGNLPCYNAPSFDQLSLEGPLTIMDRFVQCGEYFIMPGNRYDATLAIDKRKIYIFTEDLNEEIAITFEEAVENLGIFEEAAPGNLNQAAKNAGFGDPKVFENLTREYVLTHHHEFTILLFRPWDTHMMASIILMRGGSDTGNTFYGHSDFTLMQDGKIKVILGNYTYYSKAIIHNPKNIFIANNVFYEGYYGGCGHTWITPKELQRWQKQKWRLDRPADLSKSRGSLLPVLIKLTPEKSKWNPVRELDITGLWFEQIGIPTATEHYPHAKAYTKLWGLTVEAVERGTMHQPNFNQLNTICSRGFQRSWNGIDKFDAVTVNQGHHGPNVYAGCGNTRAGHDIPYRRVEFVQNVH